MRFKLCKVVNSNRQVLALSQVARCIAKTFDP